MNEPRVLLIYAQPVPGSTSFVVGDRNSLTRLRDGISAALHDTEGSAKVAFPERGREEFHVVIGVTTPEEGNTLRVPFTTPAYANRKGIDPMDLDSVCPLFPEER